MRPTPSYSLTLRVRYPNTVGMLGRVTTAIGEAGGNIGAIDIVRSGAQITRDFTVEAAGHEHGEDVVAHLRSVPGVEVLKVSDRTFLMHLGGKLEINPRHPVKTRDDLSMAYTPGVARVCKAIHDEPESVFSLTIKRNTVAIVTDGSAVLGLGDIGPEAALPVMEGKAVLFKKFGGVDAFPLCLATRDVDEIVRTVELVAPVFGGINLEDIAAPRCFDIEQRLRERLDLPVFHDDQHGTAVVVLAALLNALKVVGKALPGVKVVFSGAGAAGVACLKLLQECGLQRAIVCDRAGPIYAGRTEHTSPVKEWIAAHTNPEGVRGGIGDALEDADVFIGLSAPGVVTAADLQRMAPDPIVFAMANPTPEVLPEEAGPHVRVMATGRSDYPNQINNVLCFPGFFRGLLNCRAQGITEAMKIAAAEALAAVISPEELHEDYIIPSVFDNRVASAVARAVEDAAVRSGVARRAAPPHPEEEIVE
jgi:malate dehydrogenase (oxaloacetate-decarboxylating)